MFSREELFNGMQQLELPQQINALEKLVAEHGITDESADLISMFMMSVLMDLEGGKYPDELVQRAGRITDAVRTFNKQRFSIKNITDAEHHTLQKVFGLKHFNAPAHAELLVEAEPLVAKGWVVQDGNDLSIPDDVMWDLHAIGRPLKKR